MLGIGGYARERGVTLSCADEEGMVQWLSSSDSADGGADGSSQGTPLLQPAAAGGNVTYSLVAYPPKDNLEGRLYDWSWVAKVGVSASGTVFLYESLAAQGSSQLLTFLALGFAVPAMLPVLWQQKYLELVAVHPTVPILHLLYCV